MAELVGELDLAVDNRGIPSSWVRIPWQRARKLFAIFATTIMVLVIFNGLAGSAAAETLDLSSSSSGASANETIPGSEPLLATLPDGSVQVQYTATFQRWDGVWRPMSALNRSAGEWPYLVEETALDMRITRLGQSFTQVKPPNALYHFSEEGIKETFVLSSPPPSALVVLPFSATYRVELLGDSIALRDAAGRVVWRTGDWHAWDSSSSNKTWERPIASITYSDAVLRLTLDSEMIAAATYPLYVDPTWTLSATVGWGSSTFQDAVEDRGDHNIKIGWLADNFNDNTNEIWTKEVGTWWWTSGVMQVNETTIVRAGGPWSDQRITYSATFVSTGTFYSHFRWVDASNYYYVGIVYSEQRVVFGKWNGGIHTLLASSPTFITAGTAYKVKIVAIGNSFEIWWQGALKVSTTDSSPPPSPLSGPIKFQTSTGWPDVKVDDVRIWNTASGTMTTPVRDAGSYRPLEAMVDGTAGSAGGVNEFHVRVRSSPDNVAWGPWTNLKERMRTVFYYALPDQDRQRYYQLRVTLTSGIDETPALSYLMTNEGTPSTSPTATTGFEPYYPYVGGVVNAVTGNVWYSTGDLVVQGRGFTLSILRSYNSLRGSETGPFGTGWTFNYNEYLVFNADNSVTWNDGDGSKHTFRVNGAYYDGIWDSPRGVSSRLVYNADSTYTLWHKDGSREIFTSLGKLSALVDKNGNMLTLSYTSGRLTSVADTSGKAIYFGYDASGRIVRAWDQDVGTNQRSPTVHSGSWSKGQNAFTSNNQYASTKTASATHTYRGYGFTGSADVGIWKVEACVEAYTAGDDDLGVRISTNGGSTWSTEQVYNLLSADPNTLACLDFTSHKTSWSWSDLSDASLRVQVRYVQVGGSQSNDYLDWIPVKVSTVSRLVRYAYDGSSNLIQVTDTMAQRIEQYSYASGKLSELTDHTGGGKWTKFTYDGSNRATEIWLGYYQSGTVQWKYRDYLIAYSTTTTRTITNARGYTTSITLNSFGNPTQVSGPSIQCAACDSAGNTTSYAWDGEMNRIKVTDGRGNIWRADFDYRSNPLSSTDPGGNVSSIAWTDINKASEYISLPTSHTNYRGYTTTFAYNPMGMSYTYVKITDAKGNYSEQYYGSSGFLNRSVDFNRFTTWYEYNANGYLTKVTDPLSQVAQYGYDTWGRMTSTKTPRGYVTSYQYDKEDRLVKVTDPLGNFTTYSYNARGDLVSMTDQKGNTTSFQVNVTNGQVQVRTDASGNSTTSAYDLRGNLIRVTDAKSRVTRYEYDTYDRPTKVTSPLGYSQGFFIAYTYDAAGNQLSRKDARGYTTVYGYDKQNRVSRIDYPGGSSPDVTFTYDKNGNPTREIGFGYTKRTGYDELDRVIWVNFNYGSFSKNTTYTYDANSNRKTMVDPELGTTSYEYDKANRQTKETDPEGRVYLFGFDKDSRPTYLKYPNGPNTTYTWDAASRLTKIVSKTSGGATIESFEYTYDKAGNRLSVKLADGSVTSYEYDKLHRFTKMVEPGPWTTTYRYDAVGNLVEEADASITWTYYYDEDDRLTEVWGLGSLAIRYYYDSNGNMIQTYIPGRGTTPYGYDYENRLTSKSTCTFTYAATGERMSSTCSATKYFGYDFAASGGLADVIAEYDLNGTRVARYTHGPGPDEPVGMLRSGAHYTYQKDGLGSITRLTDAGQGTAITYSYSPWGDTTPGGGSLENPFQYTGREMASEFYHYRARAYDPGARRFLQKDPAGGAGGTSKYAYVGSNPINFVDPSGAARRIAPPPITGQEDWRYWEDSSGDRAFKCLLLWTVTILGICAGLFGYAMTSLFVKNIVTAFEAGKNIAIVSSLMYLIPKLATSIGQGDIAGAVVAFGQILWAVFNAYIATKGFFGVVGLLLKFGGGALLLIQAGLIIVNLIANLYGLYKAGCLW